MKNPTSKSNIVAQILLAAVAGVLGYLLLFVKEVQVITLCQILCGGLAAVGIVAIAAYFISGDYRRIDRYGFAYGVMLIMLGGIGLIRMNELTANFEIYAGILSLILGVLVLQSAVQTKVLDFGIWILCLLLAIVCLAGSFFVLANITVVTNLVQGFSSWVLIVNGASCLLSMIISGICIFLVGRREKKTRKEAESQHGTGPAPVPAPMPEHGPDHFPAPAPSSAPFSAAPVGGEYKPAAEPAKEPAPSTVSPAETAPEKEDLPPVEKPDLVFDPAPEDPKPEA